MSEVKDLQKILQESFITCNSYPGGNYNVTIKTQNLRQAQKMHRLIIKLALEDKGVSNE